MIRPCLTNFASITDALRLVPWLDDPDVALAVDLVLRPQAPDLLQHLVTLFQFAFGHIGYGSALTVGRNQISFSIGRDA